MTSEQQERMFELCKKVQHEHDPTAFTRLVEELNDLLDARLTDLTTPSKKLETAK